RRGAKIRYSLKPGVSTLVVAERDNLLWLFRREVRVGAAGVYIDKKLFGTSVALRKHVRRGTRNLIQGIFYLLCSPVLLFGGVEQFRAHFLRSILRFGRGWGALLGLRGKLVTPYKQIEGH
ncbi:MAG TPA: hypothetical protein VFM32_00835, partial [Spongiibacteraceae bacterium]|nr:hypothetical protein [Spongiibacteraceae bacterium]